MLSLVLPTYNEAENIPFLVDLLSGVLKDTPHEIIVVDDDSPDGTWRIVSDLAKTVPALRVIRRIGKRGLSSAVMQGFDEARGDVLVVMDADGQHDAILILGLTEAVRNGADVAIASRYVAGGSVGSWVTGRRMTSTFGTFLCQSISSVAVSDPLGGFFALRASLYRSIRTRLQPTGFKILLEVLAAIPRASRVVEIPLVFRMRLHGESKLSLRVESQFILQICRLFLVRFLARPSVLPTVFWITTVLIALSLAPQAWSLRLLAQDGMLRGRVVDALSHVVREEGWRLSDITLLNASSGEIRIRYQEHLRSPQATVTCTVALTPHFPLTCDAGSF